MRRDGDDTSHGRDQRGLMQPAVLIVDDHPENLLALEAVLAPVGARIVRAGSGEEALRAVLAEDFAAILLDVQMPGMNGFETATTIRGRQRSAHTPIIFLTALSTDLENVARGYEAGAVDYVLKPFDPLVMRSKVAVFCDLASQRTARQRADQLLRAAWDGAPNGIALVDRAGRVLQANPALLSLTGRAADELPAHLDELFPEAHRDALATLRERVAADPGASGAIELRLSARDGEELPAAVLASAVPGPEGEPVTLLLQVSDLRERLRVREARAALVHEQAARAEAEAISARLAAIAAITDGLEGHTTTELVPELTERLVRVLGLEGVAMRVVDEQQRVVAEAGLGQAVDPAALEAALTAEASTTEGTGSPAGGTTVVAMRVDGRVLGAVAVVGLRASAPGYARAATLLRNAIERAALILERARLFERERTIAATLQRDLLPETLPAVPGLAVSAYFSSGGDGVRVGGDWYDALALPGGRLGVVVGDVAGHGVAAAARMGELRSVARAYALDGHGPAEMLRRVNAYHLAMSSDTMTTLVFAVVEPDRGRARFANAGHMPLLLVPPADSGSEPHFLDALGPPLGVVEMGNYEEREIALPAGAMLALYTDGLVERRGEVLDLGLDRLRRALTGAVQGDVHSARTETLDACLQGTSDDDVTLVLVRAQERLGSPATYALTPEAEVLKAMRRHLRRWLQETGAHAAETAEITIAVNEAMQNAIEHGNAYAGAPITVALELRGDDVVIVVRDLGHDGSRAPESDRGRGIQLMSALMDDARVDLGGPMGGAVTLRRRLVRADAGLRTG